MSARLVLLFLFAPAVICNAQIQEADYIFRNWSTSEGLPQSHITDMCQDSAGFIWVTTFDGIAMFDGYSFTTFDQTNIPGLRSSFFTDLFLDADSALYFISDRDLVKYTRNHASSIPLPFKANYRSSVCTSGSDSIYYGIDDCLYFYNGLKSELIISFKGEKIINIVLSGTMIGVATNAGAKFISRSDHKIKIQHDLAAGTIVNDNESFYVYHSDSISLYNSRNGQFVSTDQYSLTSSITARLARVLPVYIKSNDTIRYLNSDRTITEIKIPEPLLSDQWGCFRDMRGNFWFGSNSNGLYLARKRFITNFIFAPAAYSEIYFVTGSPRGILSGACDRLYTIENKTLQLSRSVSAQGFCVYDYFQRNESEIYVATFQQGLIVNRSQGTDTITEAVLSGRNVFCLYAVNDSVLLIGSDRGADVYNMNTGSVIPLKIGSTYTVYQFCKYKEGQFAIATDHGILITNHYRVLKTLDTASGLKSNNVRSLYYDEDGILWIGLAKYGLAAEINGKINSFPIGTGYLDKNILSITPDEIHNFWITTNHGLQRVSKFDLIKYASGQTNTIAVATFGVTDGLLSPEFNSHTQSKSYVADNKLWLPGIKSMVCVALKDQPLPENYPLRLQLESDGALLNPDENIDFEHRENASIKLTVRYADYSGSVNRFFEYRVIETDSVWKALSYGTQCEIPITGNGTYTLQVRRPGDELPITESLRITGITNTRLLNILWIMVYILGATGAILTVVIIYNTRKQKQLRNENENLAIRLVALQKQINPHFIFNCLNSLQSLFIMNKRREANAYLVRFSSLLRAMLDYSRKEKSSLKDEISSCENYLELENLRFDESTFEYQIHVAADVPQNTVTPSFLIQPFLENSLKHGTMPGQPLVISVVITRVDGAIRIILKDNGQGPGGARQQRTNSSGIRISAERLATFNKLYKTRISFSILDRKHLNRSETGTQVEITIGL